MAARPSRRLGRVVLAVLLAAGALGLTPSPAGAAGCSSAFSASFAADLARRYPGIKVTAAVYDTRSGCWHHLNQGLRVTTASVIKAQVLGAVLLRAQDQGRGLTAWERSQIRPMIRYSFNTETSALYDSVGSTAGMHATDPRFGATATTHVRPFGLTSSTAVDRTRVALRLLHGGGDLRQAGREEAWAYMADVHPVQQWGITAGVPVGWSVALKNGFYPRDAIGWRVGSSGFVRQDDADQGYAITVMTEGAGTQTTGIRLVEEVARRAATALTVGPAAARPIDRARCVETGRGESWTSVAARLGLPASRAGDVRTVAGGDASSLSGQRVCSPDIPAEPRAAASTVNGRYRPVAADLSCDQRDDLVWYAPGTVPDHLWAGRPDRRFRTQGIDARDDRIPVAGDFDGDGCGDVLWYGPGTRPDAVWSGGSPIASTAVAVQGLGYAPVAGDFDADGRDDVLWYRPGTGTDFVWFGRAQRGRFDSVPVSVTGAYDPVVGDLDGDGADDVYWYARGPATDSLWRGRPGQRTFLPTPAGSVQGAYRPVSADLDGDGRDEIVWYAPGDAGDSRWQGLPAAVVVTPLVIKGDYLPVAGDLDGDGRDDIAWYGPGGRPESVWWGRADGGVDATTLRPG